MMDISKKTVIILSAIVLLLFSTVINISAESIWEGSAAMGRYGEFPLKGFYGSSNSFPKNTYVEIENLENGNRTRLIVVDRLENSGLLMLVSNEAAEELGMYQNDIARIRVRLLASAQTEKAVEYDDLAYNPDPDINPAASLISPEELTEREIAASRESEPAEETVMLQTEPVTEPEETDEPPEETDEPPEEKIAPLSVDDTEEAEVVITQDEVPETVATDSPAKPFDWPDSIVEEREPETEPLYLTMDEIDESIPGEIAEPETKEIPAPETLRLWPDDKAVADIDAQPPAEETVLSSETLIDAEPADSADEVSEGGLEHPEDSLELVSSGLYDASPDFTEKASLETDKLPEIIEKQEEKTEYITDLTDYASPVDTEPKVANQGLPVPKPEISEEVVSALVGDSMLIDDAKPEIEKAPSEYLEPPKVVAADDHDSTMVLFDGIDEAVPVKEDLAAIATTELPLLPGVEDKLPVNIAEGYAEAEPDEFKTEIQDYPDYGITGDVVEIPDADDEISFAEAPASDTDVTSEIEEAPALSDSADTEISVSAEEVVADDAEPVLPEYDENIEVTLEPAEERPPEFSVESPPLQEPITVDIDIDVAEGEPESVTSEEEKLPEVAGPVETVVDVSVEETPDFGPPPEIADRVVMADKLEEKKHYLQLGAFREKKSALNAAGRLEQAYPVTILTDSSGPSENYKLLVGPLSDDESGVLLYNFRAGGYSDAFIRRIE